MKDSLRWTQVGGIRLRRVWLALLAVVLVAAWWGGSAAAAPPTTTGVRTVTVTNPASSPTPASRAQIQGQVDNLTTRVDNLDRFVNLLLLPLTILVGLLAGGGVIGLITSIRYERRQAQLHQLGIAGETAAQARAEQAHVSFLAASQQTLTLVNATLDLARQANERASQAMEQKARDSLEEVDSRAKTALDRIYLERDFKAIVRNTSVRSELIEIAGELGLIEGYLAFQGMKLTPRCFFVKGFERYLRPEPRAAVRNLLAAQSPDDSNLSGLALYWAAYISNNQGDYSQALDSFRRALEYVDHTGPQRFELERILIETSFFQRAETAEHERGDRRSLISDLEARLDDFAERTEDRRDLASVAVAAKTLRANMLIWAARLSPLERDAGQPLSPHEAALLEEAKTHLNPEEGDLWHRFGRMQVCMALGEETDGGEYDSLLAKISNELGRRAEPRTHALLDASTLIVHAAQGRVDVLSNTLDDLRRTLGNIDDDSTVYSQWQKRNVKRAVFDDEVEEFISRVRAGNGRIAVGGAAVRTATAASPDSPHPNK